MTRALILAPFGALLIAASTFIASPGATSAEEVQIVSADFYFCDQSFQNGICETTVATGDTVTWDNVEGLHTVTQCDDAFGVCPLPGGFDSGFLSPDDTFAHTFDTVGVFTYWCEIHPVQMRGRIIVEQEATPTPSLAPSPSLAPTSTPNGGSPTPSPTTTPAGVPPTGAAPAEGGMPGLAIALAALGIALVAGSGVMLVGLRRR